MTKFSILPTDVDPNYGFGDNENCPYAIAFKRQFPQYKDKRVYVGTRYVKILEDGQRSTEVPEIALLDEPFGYEAFLDLTINKVPFTTTISFV